ncbi:MAG: bifunctional [glutamine synthetase] adenylyltransferase/[glutamine synthetase]-adenylyl-L-tyrosine phosphorylase [Varibaculum sp.]|nr:bifunctional [glutamine synthetase] adenylyltransferase/[glutamine synthetase]-adenylyl-L-tyrosine phosphorylase [Varibaculum sp.]
MVRKVDEGHLRLRALGIRRIDPAAELIGSIGSDWLPEIGRSADPDLAVMNLHRLAEVTQLTNIGGATRRALVSVCGASSALADFLISHPVELSVLESVVPFTERYGDPLLTDREYEQIVAAYSREFDRVLGIAGEVPVAQTAVGSDELRLTYRSLLLGIAAADLTSQDALCAVSLTAGHLAALTDATINAALAIARRDYDPQGRVKISIVAMGKTGARELNYRSDVDLVYICASDDKAEVDLALKLVQEMSRLCSDAGSEPAILSIDTSLRPEGKNGSLVRSLSAYESYYAKWAKNWEFQALLKARPIAGSPQLAKQFLEKIWPFTWEAAERDSFVEDARTMRSRVEQNIGRQGERHIKLGAGGLRDIEFSVQLLQMVHGKADERLRVRDTLHALRALVDGGYIGRKTGSELAEYYRRLRVMEHRVQLYQLRRTHLLPTGEADLRRVARCLGLETGEELTELWNRQRREIRSYQQDIFYQPLLPAVAGLSPDQVHLEPKAAEKRLRVLGYRDPAGARRHVAALASGVSRRATIQRHLLPVLLEWLADGPDPDGGLLNFRLLSEEIGSTSWYMTLLRDSRTVARRLCRLLSSSTFVSDQMRRHPESVKWLDKENRLAGPGRQEIIGQLEALAERYVDRPAEVFARLRNVRGRELLRIAISDVLANVDPQGSGKRISELNDAVMSVALNYVSRVHDVRLAVIAMGRQGGQEPGYASDFDMMVVFDGELERARNAINQLQQFLGESGPDPAMPVDLGLRPEGRDGQVARTLEGYREYYTRWISTWEQQALLRARFAAGDTALGEGVMELIDRVRYRGSPSVKEIREIMLLKARMEKERLPHGVQPWRHVKLGPGGLSDVEWVVQVGQLKYAGENPKLAGTSTLAALTELSKSGHLNDNDAEKLRAAWLLASRIRAANTLATGKLASWKLDVLHSESVILAKVSALLGYRSDSSQNLVDDYLRTSRQSRRVFNDLFYPGAETSGE